MDRIGFLLAAFGLGVSFAMPLAEAVEAQLPVRDASTWAALTTPRAAIPPRSLPLQELGEMSSPSVVTLGAGFAGDIECIGWDDYRSLCRFLLLSGSALSDVAEGAFGSFARGYGPPDLVRSSPFDMLVPLIDSFWQCGHSSRQTLRSPCRHEGGGAPGTRIAAGLFGSFAGYVLSRVAEDEFRRAHVGSIPGPGPW